MRVLLGDLVTGRSEAKVSITDAVLLLDLFRAVSALKSEDPWDEYCSFPECMLILVEAQDQVWVKVDE